MKRRVIAILVAVFLAIAGGAMVINYVNNADARAISDQRPVRVYEAQKLIPAGTTLKDAQRTGLIIETKVAETAKPSGALDEISADNNSLLALSDVQPGEFLMAARFGTTPVGQRAIEVPSGMLAMSVQLSDPARIGQFVTPGSHITIYATHGIKLLGTDAQSKAINDLGLKGTDVLLPDVQVIAMGTTALAVPPQSGGSNGSSKANAQTQQDQAASFLVTVAVTPADAVRLAHGINDYTLYAGLRGPDVKVEADGSASDMTIFSQHDIQLLLKAAQQQSSNKKAQ